MVPGQVTFTVLCVSRCGMRFQRHPRVHLHGYALSAGQRAAKEQERCQERWEAAAGTGSGLHAATGAAV